MLLTILAGVLVYALSQLFDEYILKPIHKYIMLKSKVAYTLAYYSKDYWNPIYLTENNLEKRLDSYQTGSEEVRRTAAELKGFIEEKPILALTLPSSTHLFDAYRGLIGLSNSFFVGAETDWLERTKAHEQQVFDSLKLKRK